MTSCATWIYEQVVNWHFDEIVTPSEINPFLEFSIFSKICLRRCQPSNWTFCDRHGMTHRHGPSNASSTMGRPRQRNPTTAEDRTLENDVRRTDVRRLVGRVQTCRVTRSCEEPVRPHQPCHGHATRNVASYGHASTGVVRWAYYIPRASVSPCRRWHLEMFVTEVSSEVTVANENTTRVAKAWSKSMDPIGPVEVNPWMANLDALGVGRNPSDSHRFGDFGQKWPYIGVYTPIKGIFWPKPEKTSNWTISGHREDPDDGLSWIPQMRYLIFNLIIFYNILFCVCIIVLFVIYFDMVYEELWKSCHRLGFWLQFVQMPYGYFWNRSLPGHDGGMSRLPLRAHTFSELLSLVTSVAVVSTWDLILKTSDAPPRDGTPPGVVPWRTRFARTPTPVAKDLLRTTGS